MQFGIIRGEQRFDMKCAVDGRDGGPANGCTARLELRMHDVVGKLLELFEFLYGIAPSISFGPSHRDCSPSVTGRSE